jgi:hypothetical protein
VGDGELRGDEFVLAEAICGSQARRQHRVPSFQLQHQNVEGPAPLLPEFLLLANALARGWIQRHCNRGWVDNVWLPEDVSVLRLVRYSFKTRNAERVREINDATIDENKSHQTSLFHSPTTARPFQRILP